MKHISKIQVCVTLMVSTLHLSACTNDRSELTAPPTLRLSSSSAAVEYQALEGFTGIRGLNSRGQVVGETSLPGFTQVGAVMQAGGTLRVLPFPYAAAINARGQIVGGTRDGRAAIYSEVDGLLTLGTLGGFSSVGASINDAGQIVGYSENNTNRTRPFVWSRSDGMVEIPVPELGNGMVLNAAYAEDINNRGEVVANATYLDNGQCCATRAFVWSKEKGSRFLGDLGRGDSQVTAINDLGVAVGFARVASGFSSSVSTSRAFRWTEAEGMLALSDPTPFVWSAAQDINNAGEIVGNTSAPNGTAMIRWSSDGRVTVFDQLPGVDESWGQAIAEDGRIAALVRNNENGFSGLLVRSRVR